MCSMSEASRRAARSGSGASPQKPGSSRLVETTPTFVNWLGSASANAIDDDERSTSVTMSRNGNRRSSFSAIPICKKSSGA